MVLQYWSVEDREELNRARSYSDLLVIAERVIGRMPKPVAQVCGPITTGGLGSFVKNIAVLKKTIETLALAGKSVFDQTPFQEQMQYIKDANGNGSDYDHELLREFYQPLFEKKLIDELYFIPGWESSVGTRWEHEEALRLAIPKYYM